MSSSGMSTLAAVVRRPQLWGTAAAVTLRHRPRGWWRGRRGLAAARPWIRFRLETANGTSRRPPAPEDLVTWLRWCRAWPRVRG